MHCRQTAKNTTVLFNADQPPLQYYSAVLILPMNRKPPVLNLVIDAGDVVA